MEGAIMAQSPLSHQLTSHRTDAAQSQTLMRATNAQMHAIIEQTRTLIDDGREAMLQADVVLRTSRLVAFIYSK